MKKGLSIITISFTILVALILQLVFGLADIRETPSKTVIKFANAYFMLDKSMSDFLCEDLALDEDVDPVEQYIDHVAAEAESRGFGMNYMRSALFNIKTDVLSLNENNAQIRIKAQKRKSINPLYAIVARVFKLGSTYEIDATVDVVKQDGKWKVCGRVFPTMAGFSLYE